MHFAVTDRNIWLAGVPSEKCRKRNKSSSEMEQQLKEEKGDNLSEMEEKLRREKVRERRW